MIEIRDKTQCCGCSACVQRCPKRCISMAEDEEGFFYPHVDKAICIDCGLCEKVCPVINQYPERKPLAVYAAKNPNEEIRMQSSSGGIFTMLAEKIIDEGGMVFGACWNENWEVVHDYTETKEGLARFRGSKYVQSTIGDNYLKAEQFLKAGRKVLFSGTPCQIAGLKHFLRKDYDNLLTVDIVCHSCPSPGIWQMYLSETLHDLKWNRSDVHGIFFRDKSTGWKNYSVAFRNYNGKCFKQYSHSDCFMRGFLADLYTRLSCTVCPAKPFKSGSDITLGDFWGINNIMPELDDDKGISIVLVNSEKGNAILQSIEISFVELLSQDEVFIHNPALLKNVSLSKSRIQFYTDNGTVNKRVRCLVKGNSIFVLAIKKFVIKFLHNMYS